MVKKYYSLMHSAIVHHSSITVHSLQQREKLGEPSVEGEKGLSQELGTREGREVMGEGCQ